MFLLCALHIVTVLSTSEGLRNRLLSISSEGSDDLVCDTPTVSDNSDTESASLPDSPISLVRLFDWDEADMPMEFEKLHERVTSKGAARLLGQKCASASVIGPKSTSDFKKGYGFLFDIEKTDIVGGAPHNLMSGDQEYKNNASSLQEIAERCDEQVTFWSNKKAEPIKNIRESIDPKEIPRQVYDSWNGDGHNEILLNLIPESIIGVYTNDPEKADNLPRLLQMLKQKFDRKVKNVEAFVLDNNTNSFKAYR